MTLKRLLLILFITLGFAVWTSGCGSSDKTNTHKLTATENQYISALVTRVVDGDTVIVATETNKNERVRFIGVNTPESTKRTEPFGKEASQYTIEQLTGKKIYLETDVGKRDKYDRLLAYIWLERPDTINESEIRKKMYNARLLLEGYAQQMTVPPDVKYVDYFRQYQREAREGNKGLWELKKYNRSKN